MKKMIVCLLLFVGLMANNTMAQSKKEKAVAAAVEALRKAMIDADKTALEDLTANELTYGHSSGKIEDKATFVQSIVSGASDFVVIDLSQQTIQVVNKTAIVRHVLIAGTNDGGKPGNVKLGILLVWHREGGDWKLLARQATKLP